MTDRGGWEETYANSRRQLRGVAEALIAGPQHRAAGTIRLAVAPDGFVGTGAALGVHGRDFTWPGGALPLAGTPRAIAEAAALDFGPPQGVYPVTDPLDPDGELSIDAAAAELVARSLYAGAFALKQMLPQGHPVLWPEHFDVAVTDARVNYGVSAGDDYHPTPYAYVGPHTARSGPFWNAPFGAAHPLDPALDVDRLAADIAAFLDEGLRRA